MMMEIFSASLLYAQLVVPPLLLFFSALVKKRPGSDASV